MKPPRGLSEGEAEAWARVAASVTPLEPLRRRAPAPKTQVRPVVQTPKPAPSAPAPTMAELLARPLPSKPAKLSPPAYSPSPTPREEDRSGLDGHWERKLRAGSLNPDFTLDLHEHTLDAAYQRLLGGLDIARETGARVVLVIAGRERPTHAADRADKRGAIRAKLLDWLAASRHASAIAAIRKAHRRHGGEGALYIVLKRAR